MTTASTHCPYPWLRSRLPSSVPSLYTNVFIRHTSSVSYVEWRTSRLCQVADVEARQRLRSASSLSLKISRTQLSTVVDQAFPVATAHIWNNCPSTSLLHLRCLSSCHVETHLFTTSYPIILYLTLYNACAVTLVILPL